MRRRQQQWQQQQRQQRQQQQQKQQVLGSGASSTTRAHPALHVHVASAALQTPTPPHGAPPPLVGHAVPQSGMP
jgi:hypothetical protein